MPERSPGAAGCAQIQSPGHIGIGHVSIDIALLHVVEVVDREETTVGKRRIRSPAAALFYFVEHGDQRVVVGHVLGHALGHDHVVVRDSNLRRVAEHEIVPALAEKTRVFIGPGEFLKAAFLQPLEPLRHLGKRLVQLSDGNLQSARLLVIMVGRPLPGPHMPPQARSGVAQSLFCIDPVPAGISLNPRRVPVYDAVNGFRWGAKVVEIPWKRKVSASEPGKIFSGLVYVIEGELALHLGTSRQLLHPGDFACIDTDIWVEWQGRSKEPCRFLSVRISDPTPHTCMQNAQNEPSELEEMPYSFDRYEAGDRLAETDSIERAANDGVIRFGMQRS